MLPAPMGGQTPVAPPAMGGQPAPMPPPMGAPAPAETPVTIDAVMRLLRSNPERKFRIDIETDSTISGDESQERADREALIESLTKLVESWGPIIEQQPALAPLAAELMQFGIRSFRVGRTLEETVQETSDKVIAALGQPKPPPQPSPDELIKLEGTKAKVGAEIQKASLAGQQAEFEARAKFAQAQTEAQTAERQASLEAEREQHKHGLETTRMLMQIEHDRERHQMAMQQAAEKHRISSAGVETGEERQPTPQNQMNTLLGALVSHLSAPRRVVRDANGKVTGVEVVKDGE